MGADNTPTVRTRSLRDAARPRVLREHAGALMPHLDAVFAWRVALGNDPGRTTRTTPTRSRIDRLAGNGT